MNIYKKISLLLMILSAILGCKNEPKTTKNSTTKTYHEGELFHFLWKEKRDSHELIISAITDTSYHSKALRIMGYHRMYGEVPCEINGIYTPDSGFRFTLYDSKYNEQGEGHIYMNGRNEWLLDLEKKNNKLTIPLILTSNFANIHIRMLLEQDCELAQRNKAHPKNIISIFDTCCSKSQIFYPEFEQGNPIQPLVFNKDSFLLLPGEESFYRDLFGSFIPVFSNENYISFIAQSYIFSGGAHGMPAAEMINIYKPDARILTFNEILDTLEIKKLNLVCEPFFKDQIGPLNEWNFMDTGFYIPKQIAILKDGLVFHYGAYEIGSYAQGMPEFFVPWTILKPYLRKGFVTP